MVKRKKLNKKERSVVHMMEGIARGEGDKAIKSARWRKRR